MLRGKPDPARRSRRSYACPPSEPLLGLAVTATVLVTWLSGALAANRLELLVSGAVSLKEALQEIGTQFEQHHPQVKVIFNFGASGVLQQQIERGAPVDVFVSAASKQMDDLQAKGLILDETRHVLAANVVVLIKPVNPQLEIASFKDLMKPEVKRIAIGNPRTVPAGQYAEEVLTSFNLWNLLQPKLILTENVRQALVYVIRGEVDAGLVYATDAQSAGQEVNVIATAPENSHRPVTSPIAVIKASKVQDPAKAFVRLAIGDEGQQILKSHGFRSPLRATPR